MCVSFPVVVVILLLLLLVPVHLDAALGHVEL